MTRRSVVATLTAFVLLAAVATLASTQVATSATDVVHAPEGEVVDVAVDIEHSRFSVERLRVRKGTAVRFVVRNGDPIAHELVVGGPDVHRRHRDGTEAAHPPVDGEVSVAAGTTASTVYRFDTVGTVVFACHLPRHEAYGMRGSVTVL